MSEVRNGKNELSAQKDTASDVRQTPMNASPKEVPLFIVEKHVSSVPVSREPIEAERSVVEMAQVATNHLIERGNKWGFINSGLLEGRFSFQDSFMSVLPEGEKDIKSYIEKTFANKQGNLVGIELGGSGSNVFAEFSDNFFKQTAGVSLSEERNFQLRERDEKRHHVVIQGNLLEEETFEEVKEWLGGRKIDVLFERLLGGVAALPDAPFYMGAQVSAWYSLLDEGGVMFAEIPNAFKSDHSFRNLVTPWVAEIEKNYPTLEVHADIDTLVIRIRKLEGAPDTLPLLRAKQVKEADRREQNLEEQRLVALLMDHSLLEEPTDN